MDIEVSVASGKLAVAAHLCGSCWGSGRSASPQKQRNAAALVPGSTAVGGAGGLFLLHLLQEFAQAIPKQADPLPANAHKGILGTCCQADDGVDPVQSSTYRCSDTPLPDYFITQPDQAARHLRNGLVGGRRILLIEQPLAGFQRFLCTAVGWVSGHSGCSVSTAAGDVEVISRSSARAKAALEHGVAGHVAPGDCRQAGDDREGVRAAAG